MRRPGETLVNDDSIRVSHHQSMGVGGTTASQFHNGRTIAGFRRQHMTSGDWLRIVGFPIAAALSDGPDRPASPGASGLPEVRHHHDLPIMAFLHYCQAGGEVLGYLGGSGLESSTPAMTDSRDQPSRSASGRPPAGRPSSRASGPSSTTPGHRRRGPHRGRQRPPAARRPGDPRGRDLADSTTRRRSSGSCQRTSEALPGTIVALMEDHCTARPGWVQAILRAHEEYPDGSGRRWLDRERHDRRPPRVGELPDDPGRPHGAAPERSDDSGSRTRPTSRSSAAALDGHRGPPDWAS